MLFEEGSGDLIEESQGLGLVGLCKVVWCQMLGVYWECMKPSIENYQGSGLARYDSAFSHCEEYQAIHDMMELLHIARLTTFHPVHHRALKVRECSQDSLR